MNKKLKIAIIGCGRISVCYADSLLKLKDKAELCYAVDIDLAKAERFAEPFGCNYTDELEDIFDKGIDIAHLCLPHDLHAPIAIRLMEQGIHMLTEKPIALTLQEADEMIKSASKNNVKLGCIFQTRYNDSVQRLKQMYNDGEFGKVTAARSYLSWYRPDEYYKGSNWKGTWEHEGGGTLIDQAIHSIDRVRYILGSDVKWIEGSIHNHYHPKLHVEDAAEAAICFENGCIYNLYACNYYGFDSPINIEFCGEKGRFGLIQDVGYTWFGNEYTEYREISKGNTVGKNYWGTTHIMQIEEFYDAVRDDKGITVDGLEGRKTLEMIKGIYLSAMRHERITLPFEDIKITKFKY